MPDDTETTQETQIARFWREFMEGKPITEIVRPNTDDEDDAVLGEDDGISHIRLITTNDEPTNPTVQVMGDPWSRPMYCRPEEARKVWDWFHHHSEMRFFERVAVGWEPNRTNTSEHSCCRIETSRTNGVTYDQNEFTAGCMRFLVADLDKIAETLKWEADKTPEPTVVDEPTF